VNPYKAPSSREVPQRLPWRRPTPVQWALMILAVLMVLRVGSVLVSNCVMTFGDVSTVVMTSGSTSLPGLSAGSGMQPTKMMSVSS